MNLDNVSAGDNPPWEVHALIEIPIGGNPVKYEVDKASGCLFVDRFLHTSMRYPCNYGFIPHTMSDDGDPVDILVVSETSVVPGAVVKCRPIGALVMEDEAGMDEKILAVPTDELFPYYTQISSYRNLPKILLDQISHFFLHYKDLEADKWVRFERWAEAEEAALLILKGISEDASLDATVQKDPLPAASSTG